MSLFMHNDQRIQKAKAFSVCVELQAYPLTVQEIPMLLPNLLVIILYLRTEECLKQTLHRDSSCA